MSRREHEARYDSSMTGRPKCYYCPRCGRYVTAQHVAEMSEEPIILNDFKLTEAGQRKVDAFLAARKS